MEKKIKCKVVFFDLWGTLLQDKGVMHQTQKEMGLGDYSFHFFIRRFEKATMLKRYSSMNAFIKTGFLEFKLKPERKKIEKIVLIWKKHIKLASPFPETDFVLRELKKRGFKLALVSNSQFFGSLQIMKRNGLLHFFDSIQLSFKAHSLKPNPELFRRALKELKLKPKEAIMVGDSRTDILGAQNSGMRGILIQRRARMKQYYKAVAAITNLEALLKLLDVGAEGIRPNSTKVHWKGIKENMQASKLDESIKHVRCY